MSLKKISISYLLFGWSFFANAQDAKTAWDNTVNKNWPKDFTETEIKSTVDGAIQKAWFFKSAGSDPQPLIVSLHTWSGDYNQEDPLAKEVLLRNWNYIHPDFRGPNIRFEACGSEMVITDLEDAIDFALKNCMVDTANIHIIGASGGGYATLLAYMKIRRNVKSFNSWVGISNLESWYWESKGRGLRYSKDVEMALTGGKGFDPVEARKRSPLLMTYNAGLRRNSCLNIYTGIHDGYTGSVPISQSIYFYNKILNDRNPNNTNQQVDEKTISTLLATRMYPGRILADKIGGRQIHLKREVPGLSLTIFEGGHEMIAQQALSLIPIDGKKSSVKLNILTIGDSNGAADDGWPQQLSKLLPFSSIVNKSIAGNTIGFDNLNQEKLNTLKNIDRYLEETSGEFGQNNPIDLILIGLGTNDTKKIFADRQKEVPVNLNLLIEKIKQWAEIQDKQTPQILVISPPPIDEQKADQEKYGGAEKRIQKNNPQFRKICDATHIGFIDVNSKIRFGFFEKTKDGVHLGESTQFEIAQIIADQIIQK